MERPWLHRLAAQSRPHGLDANLGTKAHAQEVIVKQHTLILIGISVAIMLVTFIVGWIAKRRSDKRWEKTDALLRKMFPDKYDSAGPD